MDSFPSGILGLSAAQVVQIVLNKHACGREETWSRRECDAGLREVRMDMINTVREEMRDQVTVVLASLENLMFLSTLVLTTGFGFVAEGTFPDTEASGQIYQGDSEFFLEVYAVLCATTIVFPLGSLMLAIAVRSEAEFCLRDVTQDMHRHIRRALQVQCHDPGDQNYSPLRRISYLNHSCSHQSEEDALAATLEDARVVHSLAQDMLRKVRYFHKLYPIARLLLGIGLLSAVALCANLLGLVLVKHHPSMPCLWQIYAGMVFAGTFVCGFIGWRMIRNIRNKAAASRQKIADFYKDNVFATSPTTTAWSTRDSPYSRYQWTDVDEEDEEEEHQQRQGLLSSTKSRVRSMLDKASSRFRHVRRPKKFADQGESHLDEPLLGGTPSESAYSNSESSRTES
eukprot:TRINITY_DN13974_c0_g1_i1.p1 TRINITY_DN13974_c0_g1~~TRINITY_DN13974_c0_g1_i1.p1  ORF type:complete len:410 (-),score=34.05 TRINITY_DN13974_c0_g1_i1:148-1344(-)